MRATAINPNGASLVGIRIRFLIVFCFGLAGGLGALAGVVTAPITFTGYNVGLMTGMKGLVAAIVGGWTMAGTLVAGLGLGLLEGLFGGFVSPGWKDAIALLVMIIFLVYRTLSGAQGVKKSMSTLKGCIPWLMVSILLVLLPLVVPSPYVIGIMVFVALYGILAMGMGLLMGHAGLFSLVHPTWFGLGAYVAGILSARELTTPLVATVGAALFVALIAYIIGAPVLRLRGLYLACATFGILIIGQIAFVQLGDLTGGHSGLLGIPAFQVAGFKFKKDIHYYYLSWALCMASLLFCFNLVRSRIGRAIISSHDSEPASASLGVNIPKYRLQVFILTAVMASLSGSVFCFYLRFASPGIFGFDLLVEIILMAVIGGLGTVWAPLLGSFIITWLHELLKAYLGRIFPVMTGEVTAVFFGIFIIFVLIFMPSGLVGWIEQLCRWGGKRLKRAEISEAE